MFGNFVLFLIFCRGFLFPELGSDVFKLQKYLVDESLEYFFYFLQIDNIFEIDFLDLVVKQRGDYVVEIEKVVIEFLLYLVNGLLEHVCCS